jgi:hypothetical protein
MRLQGLCWDIGMLPKRRWCVNVITYAHIHCFKPWLFSNVHWVHILGLMPLGMLSQTSPVKKTRSWTALSVCSVGIRYVSLM